MTWVVSGHWGFDLSLLPSFGTTHRFALLKVSGQTLQLSDRLYRAVNASPRYGHASQLYCRIRDRVRTWGGVAWFEYCSAYPLHCDGAPGVFHIRELWRL